MSTQVVEIAELMHVAGFDAVWVKDVVDNDVVMIHDNMGNLIELAVSKMEKNNMGYCWIGVLSSGAQIHCTYPAYTPCYRKREEFKIPDNISEIKPKVA